MRSSSAAPGDPGDKAALVGSQRSQPSQGRHRAGNGVVFFDAKKRRRDRVAKKSGPLGLLRAVAAIVVTATVLGAATGISLDWFSLDWAAPWTASDLR